MNRATSFLVALVTFCMLGTMAISSAKTRENERLQAGKITKNEAQHLVLAKFPGAKIKKCELSPGKEHGIFAVEFVKAGASDVTKVQVDGRSGKILP